MLTRLKLFNWIFDALLITLTLAIGWIVPTETVDKIESILFLSALLAGTIWMLHDRRGLAADWGALICFLLLGVVIVVFALRLEPIWVTVLGLGFHGNFAEAGQQLDSHPHANVFLFMGLATIYGAIVGIVRLTLIALMQHRQE